MAGCSPADGTGDGLWGDFLSDTAGPAKCEVDIEAKDDVDIWGDDHAEEKVDTEVPVPMGPAGVGDLWADMADRDPAAVPDYFSEEIPENAGDQEVVLDYDFQAAIEEDEFEDLEQPEVQRMVEAAEAEGNPGDQEPPEDEEGEMPDLVTDMMADLAEGAADAKLMPPPPPLKRKGGAAGAPASKAARGESVGMPSTGEVSGTKTEVEPSSVPPQEDDDDDDDDPMMAQFKALKEAREKGMGRVSLQAVGCGDDSDDSSD
mmetsp:Transcript_22544/g.49380  ORF Transcript_22544/g.49380 Transcript_22544/m.49380 type:complete len:260 (-) Transcript_22544:72-851(-)